MNFLKIKSLFAGITAVCLVALFAQSCTQEEAAVPAEAIQTHQQMEVSYESSTTPLAADDPILLALKSAEDVQHYNTKAGALLWDQAAMITYDSKEALPLILVPIDNGKENNISMFVAAYHPEKGEFHAFLNSLDLPATEAELENGYTGTVEYKTVENVSALKTVFEAGKVVEEYQAELSQVGYRGVDASCFFNCIRPYGVTAILAGLSGFCGNSVACCLPAPGPYNPCCVLVAGCALYYGGTAGYCAYQCWS